MDADRDIQEVRHRRRRLQSALSELEETLTTAAARPAEWCERVSAATTRLLTTLDDHIAATESDDGLFRQITEEAPRLTAHVERLRKEHDLLAHATKDLVASCRGQIAGEEDVEEIRETALDLLRTASRHRQHGSDLLYEAYHVDLAAGD